MMINDDDDDNNTLQLSNNPRGPKSSERFVSSRLFWKL